MLEENIELPEAIASETDPDMLPDDISEERELMEPLPCVGVKPEPESEPDIEPEPLREASARDIQRAQAKRQGYVKCKREKRTND